MVDQVELHRVGAVATLTLSNERKLNALTWHMYEQLADHCRGLAADPGVRVVVLRGAGDRAFAAGTDIAQFTEFHGAEDGVAYEHRTAAVLALLDQLPMPVIAAVQGPAVGAGLALVLCCDLTIASSSAVFGAPIARTLGNALAPDVLRRLFAAVGRSRRLALLMTAGTVGATEALEMGLIARVVDDDRLAAETTAVAGQVAALAPLTLRALKTADRRLLAAGAADTDDLFRMVYGSDDFAAGVRGFLTKSPVTWSGR